MTWMQRFACEMQRGKDHAFAWLLNAVMKPWRDAGVAHFQQKCSRGFVSENAQIQTLSASNPTRSGSDFVDDALAKDLLANAFALKDYRWMVRFAEEMLRGVIRAHAAEIKFYEVNPPEPAKQRAIPKIPPIKPIRGDFYFRMRASGTRPSHPVEKGSPKGRTRGALAQRKSPDLTLTGLRLMLRAQAVETALYQAKRYAWRYARSQARRAAKPLCSTARRPPPAGGVARAGPDPYARGGTDPPSHPETISGWFGGGPKPRTGASSP